MSKNIGKNNKRKGSNAERFYAKLFRELGFSHTQTSRYGSRLHDDAGIDIINVPFNVQIKAGQQRGMKPHAVLRDVSQRIKKMFPGHTPEHKYPTILIHKREVGRGHKRDEFDEIVSMSFKDFQRIVKKLIEEDTGFINFLHNQHK